MGSDEDRRYAVADSEDWRFEATVVDTSSPIMVMGKQYGHHEIAVCRHVEDAETIVDALNTSPEKHPSDA